MPENGSINGRPKTVAEAIAFGISHVMRGKVGIVCFCLYALIYLADLIIKADVDPVSKKLIVILGAMATGLTAVAVLGHLIIDLYEIKRFGKDLPDNGASANGATVTQ